MKSKKNLVAILVLVIIGLGAYIVLNQPDRRTTGEKIGDAIDKLDDGVDNAARELEDRTPAERIKDDIKDATDKNGD